MRRTSRPRSACASPPPSSSPCRRSPLEPPISTDRCQLSQEVHASPRRRGGPDARGPRSTLVSGADTAWAELRLSSLLTALSSRIHLQLCSAFYICEPVELRTTTRLLAVHVRCVRIISVMCVCVLSVVLACGWGPALCLCGDGVIVGHSPPLCVRARVYISPSRFMFEGREPRVFLSTVRLLFICGMCACPRDP